MKKRSLYFKLGCMAFAITILLVAICVCTSAVITASADLNIAYCNLSFENDTYIMYAVKSNDANVKLLIWSEPQEEYLLGTQKSTIEPLEDQMTINGEAYTVFKYTGLAAKQMADNVYARACIDNKNGNVTYGNVHKYSILQYVYNKTGKTGQASTNEKLIKMLNSMLSYGAAAQEYHEYNVDRLANSEFVQVKLTEGTLPDGFDHGLFLVGERVKISAPAENSQGIAFANWTDTEGRVISSTSEYTLTVGDTNNTYTPNYIQYSSELEFESNGDGTCYLIGIGENVGTSIKIPEKSPAGDTVIGIDRNAFSGSAITAVTIPLSVEEIGRNAFSNCEALSDVYYGGSESDWALIDIASGNTALENATKHFAEIEAFTVTFVDYNGNELKKETVNKGAAATPPSVPSRDGYTFAGWSGSYVNVTANITVIATYTPISSETYTVTFYDYDGVTVLATRTGIPQGGDATPPATPSKSGATFMGWSGSYANVTKNESVRAVYSDEKNVFVIESVTANAGGTVTMLVSLDGAVKTCGFDFVLYYDPNLTLVSYDGDLDLDMVVNDAAYENGIALNFSATSDKTKQRDIISLTFNVGTTASGVLPLDIEMTSIKEISGNEILDTDYVVVNGFVTVG